MSDFRLWVGFALLAKQITNKVKTHHVLSAKLGKGC